MNRLTENWRNSFSILLVLVSLVGLQVFLTMQLRMKNEPVPDMIVQASERLNPIIFKSMSFGQLAPSIDWVWLKMIQDPSIAHTPKGQHLQMYYDVDLLTNIDPLFMNAYVVGGNILSVVHDDGLGALAILLKGEKFRVESLPSYNSEFRNRFWGEEYDIPLLLGYTYVFEVDDLPRAAAAYEAASKLPNSPAYLKHLVQRFNEPGGQYEVGIKLTEFLIGASEHHQAARVKLLERRDSLLVGQYLFETTENYKKFLLSKKLTQDSESMKKYWTAFLREGSTSESDPWGGTLSVDNSGQITTTTPHQKVFGLE